jgi:LmbE family N-acetylglucosaminyl deacetylase
VKLVLVVAHPDDEVYGAAGTILDLLESGEEVGIVTLTQGERGRTLGLVQTPEQLAQLRAGPGGELQTCLQLLGVRNHRQFRYPDGALAQVPEQEALAALCPVLAEWSPQILLTFPPDGGNGHPDHVAASQLARAAFERVGRPGKLWYYTRPGGEPAGRLFRDVSHQVVTKLRAIAAHRSQALSTVDFLRRAAERIVLESFEQAFPPLAEGESATL